MTSKAHWEVRLAWGAPGRLRPELGARIRVEAGLSIRQRKRCARGEVWAGREERRRRSPKRGAGTLAEGQGLGASPPASGPSPCVDFGPLGRAESLREKEMCLSPRPPPQVGSG